MASTLATMGEIRRLQRADGPAAVLAIGTANPPNCVSQDEYPDFYFRVTKSEHLTDLKHKLKTMCQNTSTEKRFFHHTEELLNAHPHFLDRGQPSLDDRLEIAAAAAPELAASAAAKAIAEWGRPATDITHLIVSTNSGAHAPGADLRLASLLGLRASVQRTMLHLNGCSAGSASLRLAKDLAENNRGARVLVACVELTIVAFRGPEDACPHTLIGQATFGDGAGAVVVGADAVEPVERPLFEMVSASQTVVPGTDHVLTMRLTEGGLDGHLLTRELIPIAAENIELCLSGAFGQIGVGVEWNDLFWAVHPGMRAILDHIDRALALEPGKLAASRTVLREYGNMLGATLIFVLDEQRRRMEEDGEGGEWGVMMGFGLGFTIETMVLHATSNLKKN
ncbi:bisdemethoxycurcumin synthase-like [Lolium rigidum]|uniref:bisdemethoxycurcumin synthase-like n=1 Tax=Lolium rigidum TaxID=89674 RepID=UPI001F5D4A4D|nr:bisdemethoxycurcumin synthase-like [Lolium rigidum]XP_051212412.1 bisdemethoxycurcumin synthase-like [Lolium perenne]